MLLLPPALAEAAAEEPPLAVEEPFSTTIAW